MADEYGIVTYDNEGPITSWQRLASVQAHNNRERSEPHCDPRFKPLHIIGTGNLVEEVKARLRDHGIDPQSLRKNANIAFEAVLSASRSFFETATENERWQRIIDFLQAARAFADAAWERFRIVSMVLHVDEHTPHIHVVILPLVKKVYERWPERGEVWALVGRVISGPGEYQRVHDLYAEHMARLGLRRGEARSRAKYRPYAAEVAELEAEKEKARIAQEEAARAVDEARRERDRLAAEWRARFDRQEQIKADQEAFEKKLKLEAAAVRKELVRLEVGRRELERGRKCLAQARQEEAAVRASAGRELARMKGSVAAIQTALDQAEAFRTAAITVPYADMPPAVIAVLRTIVELERVAETVDLSGGDAAGDHLLIQQPRLNDGTGRG